MKKLLTNISFAVYRIAVSLFSVPAARYAVWAALTVTICEILNVGIPRGLTYVFVHPGAFLAATLIVYLSYSLTLFSRKRRGYFLLVFCFWLGIAIANSVLLTFRINPLSAVDFKILLSVFSIIGIYLSPLQIVLIVIAIVAAVAMAVYLIVKLPPEKCDKKGALKQVLLTACITCCVFFATAFRYSDDIDTMNLPKVYESYGFIYSFSLSCTDRGIERPDEYSRVNISNMLSGEKETETDREETELGGSLEPSTDTETETSVPSADPEEKVRPNVIFVQLESFFDPLQLKGITLSADAIPSFRALKEQFPSGQLTVPVSGAGTVNTEFEVLCGVPISVFGLGEYPYETFLTENPCESLAYYFSSEGYTSHALHNHTGTFYNRHVVFKNLGFDTFTPIEYMSDVKRNSLGWAEDESLTDEIMGMLQSTEGLDFIYAVSVQAHGKYASEKGEYGPISIDGTIEDTNPYAIEYYVNQLSETDRFVGELIERLSATDEPTVAVLFGDHQPSLEVPVEAIESGSVYTTEYAVWSNFTVDTEDADIHSYDLGTHVLDMIDFQGGVITRLHRNNRQENDYHTLIESVAYDMLFGNKYAYGGEFPYEVPSMRYGWKSITADTAYLQNGSLFVVGDGFTESSVILVDEKKKNTVYVSDELLVAVGVDKCEAVGIAQVSENGFIYNTVKCVVSDKPELDIIIEKETENVNKTE